MKNSKKKFILVDANNINITKRKATRVAGFNDFWNEYPPCGAISAQKIFTEHKIPYEFHKIAFSLPTCSCGLNGHEVLTQRRFEISKNNATKQYIGNECGRWFYGDVIPGSVSFKTPKNKEKYETILNFYEQLPEQGYLDSYIAAIKKMLYSEYELLFNNEQPTLEDKAATLLKAIKNYN